MPSHVRPRSQIPEQADSDVDVPSSLTDKPGNNGVAANDLVRPLSPSNSETKHLSSNALAHNADTALTTSHHRSRNDRLKSTATTSNASSLVGDGPTSIPQISVTESSFTTDATPSLVNGRAEQTSESLSSLSEIETVDSEAETERIDEFDDEAVDDAPRSHTLNEDDEQDEQMTLTRLDGMPPVSGTQTPLIDDDGGEPSESSSRGNSTSSSKSPSRGRKRRRRESVVIDAEDSQSTDEKLENAQDSDEQPAKRSRKDQDEDEGVKLEQDDADGAGEQEEAEEAVDEDQPEESTPLIGDCVDCS